jgi:hypothetical protein
MRGLLAGTARRATGATRLHLWPCNHAYKYETRAMPRPAAFALAPGQPANVATSVQTLLHAEPGLERSTEVCGWVQFRGRNNVTLATQSRRAPDWLRFGSVVPAEWLIYCSEAVRGQRLVCSRLGPRKTCALSACPLSRRIPTYCAELHQVKSVWFAPPTSFMRQTWPRPKKDIDPSFLGKDPGSTMRRDGRPPRDVCHALL